MTFFEDTKNSNNKNNYNKPGQEKNFENRNVQNRSLNQSWQEKLRPEKKVFSMPKFASNVNSFDKQTQPRADHPVYNKIVSELKMNQELPQLIETCQVRDFGKIIKIE